MELVLICVAIWIVWTLCGPLEALIDVKRRPRKPMEWCHKHGYFLRDHALPFMTTTICPICYREAWKKSEGK